MITVKGRVRAPTLEQVHSYLTRFSYVREAPHVWRHRAVSTWVLDGVPETEKIRDYELVVQSTIADLARFQAPTRSELEIAREMLSIKTPAPGARVVFVSPGRDGHSDLFVFSDGSAFVHDPSSAELWWLIWDPQHQEQPELLDGNEVMAALVDAWNKFVKLPHDHPDDISEFRTLMHHLQRIVLARSTNITEPQRVNPELARTAGAARVADIGRYG